MSPILTSGKPNLAEREARIMSHCWSKDQQATLRTGQVRQEPTISAISNPPPSCVCARVSGLKSRFPNAHRAGGAGRQSYRHALDSCNDGDANIAQAVAEVLEVPAPPGSLPVQRGDIFQVGPGCYSYVRE